jgi:hypothetical protein
MSQFLDHLANAMPALLGRLTADNKEERAWLLATIKATGEVPVGGTLNLKLDRNVEIREHFRMPDPWKGERQVLLFEVCRVLGTWAYRVRPLKLDGSGEGGHGDDTLEIMCTKWIMRNGSPLQHGDYVDVEFFGE